MSVCEEIVEEMRKDGIEDVVRQLIVGVSVVKVPLLPWQTVDARFTVRVKRRMLRKGVMEICDNTTGECCTMQAVYGADVLLLKRGDVVYDLDIGKGRSARALVRAEDVSSALRSYKEHLEKDVIRLHVSMKIEEMERALRRISEISKALEYLSPR